MARTGLGRPRKLDSGRKSDNRARRNRRQGQQDMKDSDKAGRLRTLGGYDRIRHCSFPFLL